MRWCIILVVLLVSVAAFGEDKPPASTAPTPKKSAAKSAPYRSQEGYKETRWGMSMAEVQRLVPDAQRDAELALLLVTGTTAGHPSRTRYVFSGGALSVVAIIFTNEKTPDDRHLARFNELRTLLTSKYGQPVSDGVVRLRNTDEVGPPKDFVDALIAGDVALNARWDMPETTIGLFFQVNEGVVPTTSIVYSGKRFYGAFMQEQEKALTKDL